MFDLGILKSNATGRFKLACYQRHSHTVKDGWLEPDDMGRPILAEIPPVRLEKGLGNRVLVVGTSFYIQELKKAINPDFGRNAGQIYHPLDKIVTQHEISDYRYAFASQMFRFWDDFFGVPDFFLDAWHIRAPRLILASGLIRNYRSEANEDVQVLKRLQQIGAHFGTLVTPLGGAETGGFPFDLH